MKNSNAARRDALNVAGLGSRRIESTGLHDGSDHHQKQRTNSLRIDVGCSSWTTGLDMFRRLLGPLDAYEQASSVARSPLVGAAVCLARCVRPSARNGAVHMICIFPLLPYSLPCLV